MITFPAARRRLTAALLAALLMLDVVWGPGGCDDHAPVVRSR